MWEVDLVVFEVQCHKVFLEKGHANEHIAPGWQYDEGFFKIFACKLKPELYLLSDGHDVAVVDLNFVFWCRPFGISCSSAEA